MYDPLHSGRQAQEENIPVELVPTIARQNVSKGSLKVFNALYKSALDYGMTSEQAISRELGPDVLQAIRSKKRNPSPAQLSSLFLFLASLNPDGATGKKERWRHANPRPVDERENQPTP